MSVFYVWRLFSRENALAPLRTWFSDVFVCVYFFFWFFSAVYVVVLSSVDSAPPIYHFLYGKGQLLLAQKRKTLCDFLAVAAAFFAGKSA